MTRTRELERQAATAIAGSLHAPKRLVDRAVRSGGSWAHLADALIAVGGVTALPAAPEKPQKGHRILRPGVGRSVRPRDFGAARPPPLSGRASELRRRP